MKKVDLNESRSELDGEDEYPVKEIGSAQGLRENLSMPQSKEIQTETRTESMLRLEQFRSAFLLDKLTLQETPCKIRSSEITRSDDSE
mgnify:CR=1 FL=1